MFKNNCPVCGKERIYKTKLGWKRANDGNLLCKSCSNSIQRGGTGAIWLDGKRKCSRCNTYKALEEFYRSAMLCKICSYKDGKERYEATNRYARYGITKETYDKMLVDQGGVCAICKNTPNVWHIDHDHFIGVVRGLLCPKCNKGLGQFDDSVTYLEEAIHYLKQTKAS